MAKILVVEDAEEVRANLIDLLEAENHLVLSGRNGREGVDLARKHLPDLILCDVLMPELDGHGVLHALRSEPTTATIPFIFLTARAEMGDIRGGMAMGADDYLTKPFVRSDLLQTIATRLQKRATAVDLFEGRMDELRRNMTHMLPHELRTPLAVILGYSSLLLESYDEMEANDVYEMLQSIQNAGERLHRLIQKFLWYLEVDQASHDPERIALLRRAGAINLDQVVAKVAGEQADAVQRIDDLQMNLTTTTVCIGETYLTILLEELLENAFKFSQPGTPVVVRSWATSSATSITTITDSGRGMTQEQIGQVGAYVQFERQKHEQQGQGIGLAIAKRIADLHGGRLTIESAPNRSTTIEVTLPTSSSPLVSNHL